MEQKILKFIKNGDTPEYAVGFVIKGGGDVGEFHKLWNEISKEYSQMRRILKDRRAYPNEESLLIDLEAVAKHLKPYEIATI